MKPLLKIFALLLFFQVTYSQTPSSERIFPEIKSYVNDNENVLSDEDETLLNENLKTYAKRSGNNIFVVTKSSIEPYEDIFEYSLNLANYLNVDLKLYASVVVFVSKDLRKIQIQNIDEIRSKLTDEETKNIIETIIIPQLKSDKYYQGLLYGIEKIKSELE